MRSREAGIRVGELEAGRHNAITDVSGVRVGHTTLVRGEGPLRPGSGPVRTGVTVIVPHGDNPFRRKVRASCHVINGFGKAAGLVQLAELGELETPIALTNTLNVGVVWDALVEYMLAGNPDVGVTTGTVNPVVAECNDGYLNDIRGRHVRAEHVLAALEGAAGGPVSEGNVGAGTGMSALGFKGGIGTASRVLPAAAGGYVLGTLVLANFGGAEDLLVSGVPVGKLLKARPAPGLPAGSIVMVLATDAPVDSRQLGRIARRAAAGLARAGSYYSHGSGDFVLAFSTAEPLDHYERGPTAVRYLPDAGPALGHLFRAAADTVEEAILNALFAAETMTGRDGNTRRQLPVADVLELLHRADCRLSNPREGNA